MPLLIILMVALSPLAQGQPAAHDKTFWKQVAANKFAVPAGESVTILTRELSDLLGSPDPELRDDIAYSTLANWIYRQRIVSLEDRRALMTTWLENLKKGVGERGPDGVLRRSFSALALGVLAILDNEASFLSQAEFDRLVASAIDYLRDERDTRGFDPAKGWMHSVAHTGDLLKFLGRNRQLKPAQQAAILAALTQKLGAVEEVLTHGEDERLARAALSIVARSDFDEAGFRTWIATLAPARPTGPPTPASLAAAQNRKNFVVSLYAVLSTDTRDLPSLSAARAIVMATLKTMM